MQLSSMIMDEAMLPVPELEPAMPYYDILWNYEDEDGNVAHIAEHGLTPEDVNAVLMAPDETGGQSVLGTTNCLWLHARWSLHVRGL
jgi:hypothetical protein